jgi:TonB family protein
MPRARVGGVSTPRTILALLGVMSTSEMVRAQPSAPPAATTAPAPTAPPAPSPAPAPNPAPPTAAGTPGANGAPSETGSADTTVTPGVTPPRLLHFEQAPYPPDALAQGIQAEVILALTIDVAGNVSAVEVLEPAGHGFDEAASEAGRKLRFEPAQKDGRAVPSKIRFRYSFTFQTPEAPAEVAPTTGGLSGQVQIADTETPFSDVQVLVRSPEGEERTVTTDAQGRFALADLPAGPYRVTVNVPGFAPIEADEDVAAGQLTELVYRLSPDAPGIEVSVRGTRPPREVTKRTIERSEMQRIPGTQGDALRSLENLPGVARPPALNGLLIVRGSAPEDTEIYVDGSPVPLIYHFGGLSSAIPTELLERIDFYPGNFSAKYGRVMGGVVDVGLRSPNTRCVDKNGQPTDENDCFHGLAQVDLIDTRALLQGPLGKGWSFAIGGRRSWIDTWLKPVLEEAGAGVTSAPVYYDYQAIVDYRPDPRSKLSFRLFGSDDSLEILIESPAAQDPGAFGGNLSLGTSYYRAQAVLETPLAPGVDLTAMLSAGKDTIGFSLGRFLFNLEIYPIVYRSEFAFALMRGLRLNAGLDFQVAPFTTNIRLPEPPRPGEPSPGPFTTRPLRESRTDQTAFRPAWYLEAEVKPTPRLLLTPGVRADYARDSGHGDVSPRITARYDLTRAEDSDGAAPARRTTLKGGAGVFYQPPQFQETDEAFGTPGLYSNRALHYSLGVERELSDQVELSVEGFYKDLQRVVSRTPGPDGRFIYANRGDGYSVGGELLLKYRSDGRFFGWLAYTLSRSVRRDNPDEAEHLFQYDQTHILTMLGSYKLGRGWEVGGRFRLVSGNLDTPAPGFPDLPAVYAADAAAYTPLSATPFSERLPLFHQLDVRVEKNWQFEDFRLTFFIDVLNAYNHAAYEAFVYNFDYSLRQYQQGLPIIPSVGFRGEF